MKKIVSIIIPFKKEEERQLSMVLSSINSQIEIDFDRVEILLINDGGRSIDNSIFDIFKNLDIKYYKIQNVGPGLARQFGIDKSDGEYFMFMDADDILFYGMALRDFFMTYREKKSDIIIGRFVEQYEGLDNQFWYKTHDVKNWSAVYAKWFKRSYIENINLRFHPELRIYEDMYFVGLACNLSKNISYMDKVVYIWLHDSNSIMRSNGYSATANLHIYTLQHRLFLEKLRDTNTKKYRESISHYLQQYLVDVYLRYELYGTLDEFAFWCEQSNLVREFQKYFPSYSLELQQQLNIKCSNENSIWNSVNRDNFKKFVEKSLIR